MTLHQTRYELRAGEAVPLSAPQDTLEFLKAATRSVEVVSGDPSGAALTAGTNRDGEIVLAAPLRTPPGDYTVKLSAAAASGEVRETTLSVTVQPLVSVPSSSTRPPVVLLNGWQQGINGTCQIANSSSDTFGNLAQYLVSDGVPVVYLFDNCREDANQSVETLGNDLGKFLRTIKYDTGAQVPQIDLVAFSMGGLIARSYLAGLQPNQSLAPPATTLVRKLVLIATPNFGSFIAGQYAANITAGSQSAELIPGSSLLWNLATWNQRADDLRGVDAIAVIGNAGNYSPDLTSGTVLTGASDGVVSLTSGSLGFVAQKPAVTRIVPYCHVPPQQFTNAGLGTFNCNAAGIANVDSTAHFTGQIVRSFLAGTKDWQSIGSTPDVDQFLSKDGAMFFTVGKTNGSYASDLSSVTFGTVSLINGGLTGTIFYSDFVFGTGSFTASSTSLGSINCGTLSMPVGFTTSLRCKLNTTIISVGPFSNGRAVDAGSTITISGTRFGGQCSGCKVVATPAGSTVGTQLTTTAWSDTSITAKLPSTFSGLITIQVAAVAGADAIAVMVNPQSVLSVTPAALQFAWTPGAADPAAQTIQITNGGSGTLAWTATASDPWIALSAASGTAPSTLSVSIVTTGLTAGTYTGSVQIAAAGASNTPASIGVTLTVTDAPSSLVVSPPSLSFAYTNGGAAAASQGIAISNGGGGTLAWTASTSAYWLVVSPASGNAPSAPAISIDPMNLAPGTYKAAIQIAAAGVAGSPAQVAVTLVVTGDLPVPSISGVANAAGFQTGIASGTWLSIFGANLSQSAYSWQGSDFVNGALPTSLKGVSVTVNGVPAYVAYISPGQINVLAPDDPHTGTVQVQVTVAQQSSNSMSAPKSVFAPAFFTFGGGVYVAALHADYSPVTATGVPAKPGETILLYGTGFGPTDPALPTGQLVNAPAPLANAVQISIGGVAANAVFAGLVGPGLYQFNVTVPNLPSGDAAVIARIGGLSTQTGVSLTIQQ